MKRSLISLWHRFAADERGAISILAVGAIVAAIGVSVIVVDAGSLLYAKRQLQAATDAAAMSAVRDIGKAGGDPTARAEEALAANGFDSPKNLQVVPGGYDADESIAAANRFDAAAGTDNAVKVMTRIDSPTYFAQFFGVPGTSEVYAESTAAMVDQASISAGTGLASLDDGVANNLLTALLGTAINLSAANYQGLIDTKIDALAFLDALATQIGVSGTYGDLLSANASVGDILNVALDVLTSGDTSQSSGDPVAAQQALSALPAGALSALNLSVSAVIDASELQNRKIGNVIRTGSNDLKVNVYDLLIAAVMGQANGKTIDLGTTVSVPITGTSISTRIAIGEPQASSKVGPVGTQVKTAQVRIALDTTIASVDVGLISTDISLPIYLEAASGTATISAIPCSRNGTMVSVTGTTGIAKAKVVAIDDATLYDFGSSPTVSDPEIARLKAIGITLATISASADAQLGQGGPSTKNFTQNEIENGTLKTVSSSVGLSTLLSSLVSNLNLSVNVLNSGLLSSLVGLSINAIKTTVSLAVVPVINALETPINQLLAALGVQVGTLDMGVNGVSCGVPRLVG